MKKHSRFILIAGTARNVGKTTLACRLIKRMSEKETVIALKFTTIKKGQESLHKEHEIPKSYIIYEENNSETRKDTSRMKKSGASKSYWIIAQENYVQEAITTFLNKINSKTWIVAESAILRKYIIPQLFIIVDRKEATNKKEYIQELQLLADYWVNDIFSFKEKEVLKLFVL